jgi:IS30 family transposase
MPPSHLNQAAPPVSGRYLSFVERERIALARAKGRGIRQIARTLSRAASTISRELRRNAATRCGGMLSVMRTVRPADPSALNW